MKKNEATKIVEAFSTWEHVRAPVLSDEEKKVQAVTFIINSPS